MEMKQTRNHRIMLILILGIWLHANCVFGQGVPSPASPATAGSNWSHPLSIQDWIQQMEHVSPYVWAAVLGLPIVIGWLLGLFHKPWQAYLSPWKYIYATIIYISCIPGMFACVLVGYTLFFTRQNLLSVNLFIYFLPIVTMVICLGIVGRRVAWKQLPGVDRLHGLMILLGITFMVVLALYKTRIWIFFGGSLISLAIMGLICFLILKLAMKKLFK